MKLSILICTIPSRQASFGRLITELRSQILIYAPEVGIISNGSTELSIGAKRNWLLEKAESDYVCFIDDDDSISVSYIDYLMQAIQEKYYGYCPRCGGGVLNINSLDELEISKHDNKAYECERCDGYMYIELKTPDCASLKGVYSVDGIYDGLFEHSLNYKEWKTTNKEVKYERYPNHLNMIRTSIAKQFKFPETSHGEDYDWSKQIHESGLLKQEHYIPEVIYYYRKITKKQYEI